MKKNALKRNTLLEKLKYILHKDTMPIFDIRIDERKLYYTCSFYVDLSDNVEITLESKSLDYLLEKVYLVSKCKRKYKKKKEGT